MKKNEENNTRRSAIKGVLALVAAWFGFSGLKAATVQIRSTGKVCNGIIRSDDIPLFSSAVKYGNLLFLAGKGAHIEGDIKAHTDHVLNEMEKELQKNGSSMEKVLKVNVYLHDLADYTAMNEVYRGRFGDHPPVRTTIAAYGGVPGNSLVEIDCIAALE
jgi:enamine deaminase RidA (YjgF/YER057c/UK114 family)